MGHGIKRRAIIYDSIPFQTKKSDRGGFHCFLKFPKYILIPKWAVKKKMTKKNIRQLPEICRDHDKSRRTPQEFYCIAGGGTHCADTYIRILTTSRRGLVKIPDT